jgi:hypothetical protein
MRKRSDLKSIQRQFQRIYAPLSSSRFQVSILPDYQQKISPVLHFLGALVSVQDQVLAYMLLLT